VCTVLENEVVFTGDTILPDITPHPSLAYAFKANRRILPESYRQENTVYGLMNYIRSLNKLIRLDSPFISAVFPAHRLFFDGQFNLISSLSARAREIIQFHIDRCREIIKIAENKPVPLDDIVTRHFPPSLLTGSGRFLATDEIRAHIEVLEGLGDVRWVGEDEGKVQQTGSRQYLGSIGAYLS